MRSCLVSLPKIPLQGIMLVCVFSIIMVFAVMDLSESTTYPRSKRVTVSSQKMWTLFVAYYTTVIPIRSCLVGLPKIPLWGVMLVCISSIIKIPLRGVMLVCISSIIMVFAVMDLSECTTYPRSKRASSQKMGTLFVACYTTVMNIIWKKSLRYSCKHIL